MNSENCIAYEYDTVEKSINMALVIINGRYPDKGRVFNRVSKELVHVIKGEGRLIVDDKRIILESGDQVLIESGEKYHFNGKLELLVSCTPAWSSDQHELTE
jgi:mannose-6-phosphate isomerase-like protein (cupin superfamily)